MTMIHLDPLYEDAAVYLVAISRVSPTALQRKFRIGLSRALRLIQQMEQEGLIASVMLSALICKAFGVHSMFTFRRTGCQCNFIGNYSRVEIAAYCYAVLARQIVKARQEYIASLHKRTLKQNKTAKADLFCEGWLMGVYQQVIAMVPDEKETVLIKSFIEQRYPNMSDGKIRESKQASKNCDSMVDGYRSGSLVKLHVGVAGQEQAKLELAHEG